MLSLLLKVSLRVRLTVWYSAIVVLSVSAFGILMFTTVSRSLHANLDASLQRVATSLEYIIKNKQGQTNKPLAPVRRRKRRDTKNETLTMFQQQYEQQSKMMSLDSTANEEANQPDVVWSAVYEHILLNSKNFYIQISTADKNVTYWRSVNLDDKALPVLTDVTSDTTAKGIYTDYVLDNQKLRAYVLNSSVANVTVGYPLTEIQDTLNELFGVFLFGLPVALFISILGGYLLARYSLRQVDVLTHTAHEITAHNLGMRLPAPPVNDEIGRLTDTLNEMIARLESSFAQIRQFTSDASHELRTPLAILMGELELILRRPRTPDDYQQAISSALEEVVRLSKVVESLLDISRGETGQARLQLDLMNISKLTEDICEDLEIIAAEKHIDMQHDIQPFATIVGDQPRLHQVLLNVIDNAIKYTREGGSVFVKLRVENTQTIITVSDTGIGIPPEDIPHIFDRFYRVDKSRTRYDVPGTGLGLSIVKWIVDAHHGTISASSIENSGTTFTIILPADPHAVVQ